MPKGIRHFAPAAILFCFCLGSSLSAQAVIFEFEGRPVEDFFGAAVGGGGDVNADGTPDIIVSATSLELEPHGLWRGGGLFRAGRFHDAPLSWNLRRRFWADPSATLVT